MRGMESSGWEKKYSGMTLWSRFVTRTATKGPLPAGPEDATHVTTFGRGSCYEPRPKLPTDRSHMPPSCTMAHWSRFVMEPGPMGQMDGSFSSSDCGGRFSLLACKE